ncbi:MAG TPA: glycosyltransferase [Edaphobacter sp.]|nr:glycosyltransferase [Edaphobacter sp.]
MIEGAPEYDGTVEYEGTIGPELSVIVPARNEELSLPACLVSLVSQSQPGFELGKQWELIVIDDHSTDETGNIAEGIAQGHPGVMVILAPELAGDSVYFTGKNNACWAGARLACGRWLLFTDADTIHQPGDLSRSLQEAKENEAALLSYSPRQIVTGFWQRAVMPLVFSELASVYRMSEINDPKSSMAAANGQFVLIERETYFAVGGHRAVAGDVLEDVALARKVKQSERIIRFRYAPDALSTRMYRSTRDMIEGWTKNLAVLFPRPVYLAAWRTLDFALYLGLPLLALGIPWLVSWQRWALVLLWVRTLWRFHSRVARSNFPAADVALSILGVPLFVFLLVRSTLHHTVRKSVVWKGRSYSTRN